MSQHYSFLRYFPNPNYIVVITFKITVEVNKNTIKEPINRSYDVNFCLSL